MSNDLSKALKRKTDAQLRLIEQDSAPIVRETVSGDVYAVSPTDYMQTLAAGKNISITTAGNVKTISAEMNLVAGGNIEITEAAEDGSVTISSTASGGGSGMPINSDVYYQFAYDETSGTYFWQEAEPPSGGSSLESTSVDWGIISGTTLAAELISTTIDAVQA